MTEEKNDLGNFFQDDADIKSSKVPYDEEPISRGGYRYRTQSRTSPRRFDDKRRFAGLGQVPMFAYLMIAILFVINIVTGIVVYGIYNSNDENSPQVNITYPGSLVTTSGSVQLATAKAIMSSCAVACTMSNVPMGNENDFYNNPSNFGSGVVVGVDKTKGDIYIATNFHVIYQVSEDGTADGYFNFIWVLLSDSLVPIQMEFVGGSANYDVAVLKATDNEEVKKSNVTAATFADSTDIYIGQTCIAVGNSRAQGLQATTGNVSVEEEVLMGSNAGKSVKFMLIRHSAEINGGNSGGGLFDINGNVIGLVNGRFSATDSYLKSKDVIQGMNFALPGSIVQSIINNILFYSIENSAIGITTLMRPKLGIFVELLVDSSRNQINSNCSVVEKSIKFDINKGIKTIYQIRVNENTSTGFKAGDIIKSFTYNSVVVDCNKKFSIDSHIYNLRKGDTIKFYVQRPGVSTLVEIEIKVNEFTPIF